MKIFLTFIFVLFFAGLKPTLARIEEKPNFPLEQDWRSREKEINDIIAGNSSASSFYHQADGALVWTSSPAFLEGTETGLSNVPNSQIRQVILRDKKIEADFITTNDRFGRRHNFAHNDKAQNFIALLGCSFTYGHRIEDDETLSYYLAKELPGFKVYNYGISGTGTNSHLKIVESQRFKKEIPESAGMLIYVSLGEEHVRRSAGTLPTLKLLKDSPYYVKDGADSVKQDGTFLTGRSFLTSLLLNFYKWQNYVFIPNDRVIPWLTNSDFDVNCRMIKKMERDFLEQYPSSKFLVYIHPKNPRSGDTEDCLKKYQIPFVVGKFLNDDPKMSLPNDRHPSPLANRVISRELKEIILRDLKDDRQSEQNLRPQ